MRVGVRELKNQATEILRQVRENHAEYVVTYHGRPVAVLLPVDEQGLAEEAERAAEAARPREEVSAELERLWYPSRKLREGSIGGRSRRQRKPWS